MNLAVYPPYVNSDTVVIPGDSELNPRLQPVNKLPRQQVVPELLHKRREMDSLMACVTLLLPRFKKPVFIPLESQRHLWI